MPTPPNAHTCKQNAVMNYQLYFAGAMKGGANARVLLVIHTHGPQAMSEQEKSTTTLTLKFVCLTTGTRATMSSSLKGTGEENSYSLRQSCIPGKGQWKDQTIWFLVIGHGFHAHSIGTCSFFLLLPDFRQNSLNSDILHRPNWEQTSFTLELKGRSKY